MLRQRTRALLCIVVCLMPVYASALSMPDLDPAWQWFDLQRRDLPAHEWWEAHGGDFASARPAQQGPAGLARLFPDAIWYTGNIHLVDVEPIPFAIRTYAGRQYTDLWLYVDTDADGRLADETKLPATRLPDRPIEDGIGWWPTFGWPKVTVALDSEERAGETLTFDLISTVLGPEYNNTIDLTPRLTEEWVASGTFEGQAFEWHFLDFDGDGRIAMRSWMAGDRVMLEEPLSAGAASVFQADRAREVTTVGSKLAKLTIDWPNRRIGIRPYDEPTHTVHLSATDGRGRPMEIVSLTVGARGIEPITWHRPADTIRVPVYQRRLYVQMGGELSVSYKLRYPDRPDATWEFLGPADVVYDKPTEITLELGGPLHVEAQVLPHRQDCMVARVDLRNARGDKLHAIGGSAELQWDGWFIAPDGTVIGAMGSPLPVSPWTLWGAVATPGGQPEHGTWWVNVICDPGEYQEPIRGSGRGEL